MLWQLYLVSHIKTQRKQVRLLNILENSIKDTIQTEKTINEEIDFVFDAITNSTTGK